MTKRQSTDSASLYIVATPIGHLDDISLRALNTLKSVDFIIAEDTRHSGTLLTRLGIKKPLTSLHAFNESSKTDKLIDQLLNGQSAALISDAGTPLISDPGYPLVKAAREKGIQVIPIPGACAFVTALSAAGIPCDVFTFAGFLPAKQSARLQKLKDLSQAHHTVVLYESTHRILPCIEDIMVVFGEDTPLVLAKELTKSYETFISGTGAELLSWLSSEPARQKGEFVLIISPKAEEQTKNDYQEILLTLMKELPLKQAVKLTSQITQENKNEIYQTALALQAENK